MHKERHGRRQQQRWQHAGSFDVSSKQTNGLMVRCAASLR